ncbi:hypothetical protein [Flavobacterium profundi]|nr:hypothetical protein [Flavobacterium profundi]
MGRRCNVASSNLGIVMERITEAKIDALKDWKPNFTIGKIGSKK